MKIEQMGQTAQTIALKCLCLKKNAIDGAITFETLLKALLRVDGERQTANQNGELTQEENEDLFTGIAWILFNAYNDESDKKERVNA